MHTIQYNHNDCGHRHHHLYHHIPSYFRVGERKKKAKKNQIKLNKYEKQHNNNNKKQGSSTAGLVMLIDSIEFFDEKYFEQLMQCKEMLCCEKRRLYVVRLKLRVAIRHFIY
uniref:Uncharacterized protein n=1 Tax=Glossina palpalis gambiensis TaxID=67801 RepID=A0A1B0BR88_9MUSC